MIESLDHINIETRDLGSSLAFYRDVLGLENGPRPPFDVPGAWLYCAGRPIVHLVVRPHVNEGPTGAIHHVAVRATDFEGWSKRLDEKGVAYRVANVPGAPVIQVFITDPNSVVWELNYDRET